MTTLLIDIKNMATMNAAQMGRVEYNIEVDCLLSGQKLTSLKRWYTVNYRPTVEWQMNNQKPPKEFILVHLESLIRKELEEHRISEFQKLEFKCNNLL